MPMETLTKDVLEIVLGRLPLRELLKAATVSKDWRRIILSSILIRRRSDNMQRRQPWLFVLHTPSGALKAFDPVSLTWLPLPLQLPLSPACAHGNVAVQAAAGDPGLLFEVSGSRLRYGRVSGRGLRWQDTPPMRWWRLSPVVCYMRLHAALLVAGGAAWQLRDGGGGGDDGAQDGCVEIFGLDSGRWETAEPLPRCFRRYSSSTWVRAASDGGDRAFVAQDCGAGRLMWACFHMGLRRWSAARAACLPGGDGLVPRTLSLVGGTALGVVVAGLAAADGAYACRALLWQLPDVSDADAESGDDMKAAVLCEMPRSVTAAVVGPPVDPVWYSLLCVGAGDLLFFHSDRTHVLALCHLPTLSWSAFTVDGRLSCGDGGGVDLSRSNVMPCLSSKTVVCAPVTLDQVVSSEIFSPRG